MVTKKKPTQQRQASWITRKVDQQPTGSQLPVSYQQLQALIAANQATGQLPARRGGKRLPAVAPVAQLPQLGGLNSGEVVPAQVVAGQVVERVQRPGDQTAMVSRAVGRWLHRYRWQLSPVVATAATMGVAAGVPGPATIGLSAAAALGLLAAHKAPDTIGGRAWLSKIERFIVARWLGGAAGWASGVWVAGVAGIDWTGLSVGFAGAALGATTGTSTVAWLRSRQIRTGEAKQHKLSEAARQLMTAWPVAVAQTGVPAPLQGSMITDVTEPNPGTMVAAVKLRDGVHAEKVAVDETRLWLERALRMGVDTAKVELDRDDAGRVRLVLTPSRHLEEVSKVWPGPVLHPDGRVPIAVNPEGTEAFLQIWAKDGIRHLVIIGSPGSGKTNTYNVLLLPGVLAGKVVYIYVDGKRGTSSPGMAGALDTVARKPDEWRASVEMAHAIMIGREDRYGEMGLDEFDVNGPDPIVVLVIDEGSTVAGELTEEHDAMIMAIAERGRALGVALYIGVQRPNADRFPGGMAVRDALMGAAGNVVGLRPGGSVSKGLTLTATDREINLLGLPKGGGWCAILSAGAVESEKARVLFIPDRSHVAKHLDGFTIRTLTGEDARAAGATYTNRRTGAKWLEQMAAARARHGRGGDQARVQDTVPGGVQDTVQGQVVPNAVAPAGQPDSSDAAVPVAAQTEDTRPVRRSGNDLKTLSNSVAQLRRAQGETNTMTILAELKVTGETGASTDELVDRLGLAKSTVNKKLKALVDDGLVERRKDNGNARLRSEEAAA